MAKILSQRTWSWDDDPAICTKCHEKIVRDKSTDSPLMPGMYAFFNEPSPVEWKMLHMVKHELYWKDKKWREAHPGLAKFKKPYDPNRISWRKG